jgi:hypothetical protein
MFKHSECRHQNFQPQEEFFQQYLTTFDLKSEGNKGLKEINEKHISDC